MILLAMTALVIVGLFCVRQANASSQDLDKILMKQMAGVGIGFLLLLAIVLIDYRIICRLSFLFYLVMNAVLAVTLLFGGDKNGVKRWIMVFGIPFQPSEMAKLALILFLAFLCDYYKNKLDKLYVLVILFGVAAVPTVLILLEPHLSSGLALLFISCVLVYSSGISYKVIGKALLLMVPVILVLFIAVFQFNVKLPFIEKYQINRVLSFMSTDESEDLSGNYQQLQSLEAIASGGLHGKAIVNDGEDRSYRNIYAKESDFVFAIVGEEFGFIGCSFIIFLYAVLIIKCLRISARTSDYLGRLLCIGVSTFIMFQTFVNIGVATDILPNTGLPLPFISNGLTSLITSMAAVGLVLNVELRQKKKS